MVHLIPSSHAISPVGYRVPSNNDDGTGTLAPCSGVRLTVLTSKSRPHESEFCYSQATVQNTSFQARVRNTDHRKPTSLFLLPSIHTQLTLY